MKWKSQFQAKLPVNSRSHSSTFRYWDLSCCCGRGGTWRRTWERPNRQGGNRVSTISLLGRSTSVVLATDTTDEEENNSFEIRCLNQEQNEYTAQDLRKISRHIKVSQFSTSIKWKVTGFQYTMHTHWAAPPTRPNKSLRPSAQRRLFLRLWSTS